MNEIDVVALMVQKAKEMGLLAEVVHAFGEYRARGDSVSAAVTCALWDYQMEIN
jgi:uncharacterized protein (DUF169 family)